jgi:HEAT repeat protein
VSHALLARFGSSDPAERARACRSAGDDPSGVLLLDALEAALGDPVVAVARAASDAVGEIGARAGGVDEVLRRALRSDCPNARWAAALASARLAPPGPSLLPPLVEALTCEAGDVRWRAARVLVASAHVLPETQPLLCGLAASDPRPRVRQMAAHCLRELAPHDPETARVLLAATRDRDLQVRRASLSALAALSAPPPAVAERLLATATDDTDAASRRIAAGALAEVARRQPAAIPAAAVNGLKQMAAGAEDGNLRAAAQRALESLSGAGAETESAKRAEKVV